MSQMICSSLAPTNTSTTNHNTGKMQKTTTITLNDTSTIPEIPANSRITNKRYTKTRNPHTES
jgi:hypothetical protein